MAEENTLEPAMKPATAAAGPAGGAQFQIQKLYAKDVSFELPNAPQVFQQEGQADVKMSLAQRVENLGENLHEVVLTVTVTATVGDKTGEQSAGDRHRHRARERGVQKLASIDHVVFLFTRPASVEPGEGGW